MWTQDNRHRYDRSKRTPDGAGGLGCPPSAVTA